MLQVLLDLAALSGGSEFVKWLACCYRRRRGESRNVHACRIEALR
jgi:hypothetical protein